MAAEIGWFREDGVWKRTVGDLNTWAFVRLVNRRYEVAIGTNGKPRKWEDYCDANGGSFVQECKAKRRATALARKLIKEQACSASRSWRCFSPAADRTRGGTGRRTSTGRDRGKS